MKRVLPVVRYQMGLETPEDIALFDAFTAAMPLAQLRIQIAAVLGWCHGSGAIYSLDLGTV
jgi:hypothetical protein